MKKRLFYLDLVRTIAVIAVLGCHFTRQLEYAGVGFVSKILPDFICNVYMGSFGVGLFFIVSGASLMHVYSEKLEVAKFYAKRFWAIYPMFWIAYLLAFLFEFYRRGGLDLRHPKGRFLLTVFGMDGYLGFFWENYYLLGEWFLGCLILLYLLFPLLRWGVKKHPIITAVIALAMFAVGIWYAFTHSYKMNPECWVFMRIPELLFGMYYVEYFKKVHWTAVPISLIFLIAMQRMDIIMGGPQQIMKTVPVCIAAFLVITFIADHFEIKIIAALCQLVGKYSYAVFLCHHFILMKLSPHFNGKILSSEEVVVMFLLALVIIAVFSKLLFTLNQSIVNWVKGLKKGERV